MMHEINMTFNPYHNVAEYIGETPIFMPSLL